MTYVSDFCFWLESVPVVLFCLCVFAFVFVCFVGEKASIHGWFRRRLKLSVEDTYSSSWISSQDHELGFRAEDRLAFTPVCLLLVFSG